MCGEHRTHPIHTAALTGRPHSPGPRSPAEVREAVRHAFEGARQSRRRDIVGDDNAVGDALLVASELTTNAMLHGGGVTDFEVTLDDRDVHLSVSDRSQELPTSARGHDGRGSMRTGGHGWPIVCRSFRESLWPELTRAGHRIPYQPS